MFGAHLFSACDASFPSPGSCLHTCIPQCRKLSRRDCSNLAESKTAKTNLRKGGSDWCYEENSYINPVLQAQAV